MIRVGLILFGLAAFVGCHSVQKREDGSGIEAIVDEFIYEMTSEMKEKHKENISIPDIDEKIKKKWKFIKISGEFTGKGGWFKDVSTLKRRGNMEMNQINDTITLGISFGLDDMEFGFNEYRAEVWHIGVHGKMTVSVGENQVYGHLTIKTDDKGCKTTLDKIQVTKLDGFHVDMTGLGKDADWIYSFAVQFLANKYHEKIAGAITEKLDSAIKEALLKKDICDKIPFI